MKDEVADHAKKAEDAMNHTTIEFTPGNRDRLVKPVCGALAVLATVATLSLMVAGPAVLAPATADVTVLARRAPAAIEVAIEPASIQVVGTRSRIARNDGGAYLPATYRTR